MSFFKMLCLTFFLIGSKIFAPSVDAETQTSNKERCRGFGCKHQKRDNEPWFRFGNFRRWREKDIPKSLLRTPLPPHHEGVRHRSPGMSPASPGHRPPPPPFHHGRGGPHHRPPPGPHGICQGPNCPR